MKLSLLGQLAQLMLGLGLGAALGLAFDVLRVPRRHARSAVFRALLDGAFCLLALGSVFLLGMTAGDGQVRLFLFAAIAGGWTCYFLWLSGHIFPQLERSGRLLARKMRQITAPGRKFIKKVLFFAKKHFQSRRRCFRIGCITGRRYDPGGGTADREIQEGKHIYQTGYRGADGVRTHQSGRGASAHGTASGPRRGSAAAGVRDDPVQCRAAISDRPQRRR
nr:MAG TPA: hypothetical protein [Caudoviricetes sp.]